MNPKGKKLGTYGLEGIKESSTEPPEVDLKFDTWLGVQILVAALGFVLDTCLNPIG